MSSPGQSETSPAIQRPIQFSSPMIRAILDGTKTQTRRAIVPEPDMIKRIKRMPQPLLDGEPIACKFGDVGDRLWVRERWAFEDESSSDRVVYAADDNANGTHRWRPSYMMPRAACRIVLEITSLRIERLATITRHD